MPPFESENALMPFANNSSQNYSLSAKNEPKSSAYYFVGQELRRRFKDLMEFWPIKEAQRVLEVKSKQLSKTFTALSASLQAINFPPMASAQELKTEQLFSYRTKIEELVKKLNAEQLIAFSSELTTSDKEKVIQNFIEACEKLCIEGHSKLVFMVLNNINTIYILKENSDNIKAYYGLTYNEMGLEYGFNLKFDERVILHEFKHVEQYWKRQFPEPQYIEECIESVEELAINIGNCISRISSSTSCESAKMIARKILEEKRKKSSYRQEVIEEEYFDEEFQDLTSFLIDPRIKQEFAEIMIRLKYIFESYNESYKKNVMMQKYPQVVDWTSTRKMESYFYEKQSDIKRLQQLYDFGNEEEIKLDSYYQELARENGDNIDLIRQILENQIDFISRYQEYFSQLISQRSVEGEAYLHETLILSILEEVCKTPEYITDRDILKYIEDNIFYIGSITKEARAQYQEMGIQDKSKRVIDLSQSKESPANQPNPESGKEIRTDRNSYEH